MTQGLDVQWLGRVEYAEALRIQMARVEARRAGRCGDSLLLLEHPAVVTLGRSAHERNLLRSRDELAGVGIAVHEINRGGDVTYHAPGQLVGYLVVDLAESGAVDVGRFLRDVEGGLIDSLELLGIAARRIAGMTGVYAEGSPEAISMPDRKIASIGIGVRGWVSFHGFALNVNLDLGGFDAIVPCGLSGVEMTSVAKELGQSSPDLDARTREIVTECFSKRFG